MFGRKSTIASLNASRRFVSYGNIRPGRRLAAAGALWVVVAATAPSLHALQRPREMVVIAPPLPDDRTRDSAFAVELTHETWRRMNRWRRLYVGVYSLCDIADCLRLHGDVAVEAYADVFGADVYFIGRLRREGAMRVAAYRLIETGRLGGIGHESMQLEIREPLQASARDVAERLADVMKDSLDAAFRATESARECWAELRDRDPEDAREKAHRALEMRPTHASAAFCLARVLVEEGADRDSVEGALLATVAWDTTITDAWEALAGFYLREGDTARAVAARAREVQSDPDNVRRRVRVAGTLDSLGQRQAAVDMLREGVARTPQDLDLYRLLVRACLAYQDWSCALDALSRQYSVDSSLAVDTTFFYRVIGLAQTIDDTAAAVRWTGEAVDQMAAVVAEAWNEVERRRAEAESQSRVLRSLWMARALAFREAGDADSALAYYEKVWESDPTGGARALLAAAQLLVDPQYLPLEDTLIDTTAVVRADSLLRRALAVAPDDAVRETAATVYLDLGGRLVGARRRPELALAWLETALALDDEGPSSARTHGLIGLARFYLVQELDTAVREQLTCGLVGDEERLIHEAREAMTIGADAFPGAAPQVFEALDAYEALVPQYASALDCGGR